MVCSVFSMALDLSYQVVSMLTLSFVRAITGTHENTRIPPLVTYDCVRISRVVGDVGTQLLSFVFSNNSLYLVTKDVLFRVQMTTMTYQLRSLTRQMHCRWFRQNHAHMQTCPCPLLTAHGLHVFNPTYIRPCTYTDLAIHQYHSPYPH